jgi:hypothetical protein
MMVEHVMSSKGFHEGLFCMTLFTSEVNTTDTEHTKHDNRC